MHAQRSCQPITGPKFEILTPAPLPHLHLRSLDRFLRRSAKLAPLRRYPPLD
jgi:hypothetical protein